MTRILHASSLACVCLLLGPSPGLAQSTRFDNMTLEDDATDSCAAPRPPRELAETAYIRNGYRAILRIMAAEKWQETGSCACFLQEIRWEDVVAGADNYATSDHPLVPFKVVDLNTKADALEEERNLACQAD